MSLVLKKMNILMISIAIFMEFLDSSILNTAIPALSVALKIHPIDLKMALISYLMSLAIVIPISGWVCERFGVKKIFLLSTGIFSFASLMCGCAQNIYQLVFFRFLQGIGGAMNFPIARLIIFKIFPKNEYVKKMNAVLILSSVAILIGPLLGGIIVENLNWPWIFWINLPFGILNLFLIKKYFIHFPKQNTYRLDKLGFLLFALALSSFLFYLIILSDFDMNFQYSNQIVLFSIVCFLLYFIHSKNQRHPIVLLKLFRDKTFALGMISGTISRLTMSSLPFLLPIFFQIELYKSPSLSGFLIMFWALGALISRIFSLKVLEKIGFKKTLIINSFLVFGVMLSFCTLSHTSSNVSIAIILLMGGIFSTIQSSCVNALLFDNISEENVGASSSLFSIIQQVGMSLSIALSALFLSTFSEQHLLTEATFIKTFMSLSILPLINLYFFSKLDTQAGESLIKH